LKALLPPVLSADGWASFYLSEFDRKQDASPATPFR
jgi:hypothetical protein